MSKITIHDYPTARKRHACSLCDEGIRPGERYRRGVGFAGHSRAMRRMSDEPNVEPGTNPYRAATPPTTTEETTHE